MASNKTASKAPATKAPAAPAKAAKPAPTQERFAQCKCGCGANTVRPSARYIAGHDARHAGAVARDAKQDPTVVFKDSPKLRDKALAIRATATRKEAEKAARKAAKAQADKAYKAALEAALAKA